MLIENLAAHDPTFVCGRRGPLPLALASMCRPTQRLLVQSSTTHEQARYSTVWRLLHPIRATTSLRIGRVKVEIPHDSGLGAPLGLSPIVTRSITRYLVHDGLSNPSAPSACLGDSLSRSCCSPVLLLLFFFFRLKPNREELKRSDRRCTWCGAGRRNTTTIFRQEGTRRGID